MDPRLEDLPTAACLTTWEYAKKAISYFMPNGQWDEHSKTGNLMCSDLVTMLLSVIQKREVWSQGQESQARQDMEHSEFEQMLTMLQAIDDFWKHFAYPMMAKFQYNMMAWLDDTVGLKIANFKSNPQFPFTIQCQLSWSKNVHEERSIPYQILLGWPQVLHFAWSSALPWTLDEWQRVAFKSHLCSTNWDNKIGERCLLQCYEDVFVQLARLYKSGWSANWNAQPSQATSHLCKEEQLHPRRDWNTWLMAAGRCAC